MRPIRYNPPRGGFRRTGFQPVLRPAEVEEEGVRAGVVDFSFAPAQALRVSPDQRLFRHVAVAEDDPDAGFARELSEFVAVAGPRFAVLAAEDHAGRERVLAGVERESRHRAV